MIIKSGIKKVFVTGGAGYVGARLIPSLLKEGYKVTVLDLMLYGRKVLKKHSNLKIIKGDIRNKNLELHALKEQMRQLVSRVPSKYLTGGDNG